MLLSVYFLSMTFPSSRASYSEQDLHLLIAADSIQGQSEGVPPRSEPE